MLLFVQALSTEGWQGDSLPDRACRGKPLAPPRLDRKRKIVLPLAVFRGQSMIGGTCCDHPLEKAPPLPGVAREKERRQCGPLDWTGPTPITMWRYWMRRASASDC